MYKINAESLFLSTEKIFDDDSNDSFHKITIVEAKDNIIAKHSDYQICGENLIYFPKDNLLKITNKVDYASDFAKLKCGYLSIENESLFANSDNEKIEVILPNSKDLSFEFNEKLNDSESSEISSTIVRSDMI